jgi:glycine C-acetyltransferase
MESDASLVDRLWDNASYWKEGLHKLGFDTGTSETPITPVMLGDESAALRMQGSLLEEGVLALAIVYPTVPRGRARLRTMPSAMHSRADLDEALEAFRRCG